MAPQRRGLFGRLAGSRIAQRFQQAGAPLGIETDRAEVRRLDPDRTSLPRRPADQLRQSLQQSDRRDEFVERR